MVQLRGNEGKFGRVVLRGINRGLLKIKMDKLAFDPYPRRSSKVCSRPPMRLGFRRRDVAILSSPRGAGESLSPAPMRVPVGMDIRGCPGPRTHSGPE